MNGHPLLAAAMLEATSFGWPLIAAGAIKVSYDLLLLRQLRSIRPPEELPPPRPSVG